MILDKILNKKRERIEERKRKLGLTELIKKVEFKHNELSFLNAIKKEGKLSVIAEVKKASPSKGIISSEFNYLETAIKYQKSGASAISVLTEEDFFLGSDKYLEEIRNKVSVPLLRKDFVVDEYQIYESKLLNANCILLICRILPQEILSKFYKIASEIGLDCLFEAHNEIEVNMAIEAGAKIIGINNRDLDTFNVDLNTSEKLIKKIPDNIVRVSESGINNQNDFKKIFDYGYDAVLVGEYLMKLTDNNEYMDLNI